MHLEPLSPRALALLALAALACLLAVSAPKAHAASCSPDLVDAAGQTWELSREGGIDEAGEDAFDGTGGVFVEDPDATPGAFYPNAGADACTHEDGGREVRYPEVTIDGLAVTRTVFVPADATFGRVLTLVSNPGAQPAEVRIDSDIQLGSDGDTTILGTSSGDSLFAPGDRWFASHESDGEDSAVAYLLDGLGGAVGFGPSASIVAEGVDSGRLAYPAVTVGPSQTAAFMHVVHVRNRAGAVAFAAESGNGTEAMYAGLSADERAALRNWPSVPDTDADGRRTGADNCEQVANPDQADLDRDGIGDVCDPDVDGDGLADVVERAVGTDPAAADSDRDGRGDREDPCPTVSGTDNGCPSAAAPAVTGGTPRAVAVAALAPRGLNVTTSARRRGSRTVVSVKGTLTPPAGRACAGTVVVRLIRGDAVRGTLTAAVRRDCSFRAAKRVSARRLGRRPLVVAAYEGAEGVLGRVAPPRRITVR